MDVPVLYLVFNRPYHTGQSFEALRRIKPRFLFIGADGPRPGNRQDELKCAEVRSIVSRVDWDCEKKILFNENNLGTKVAVSNAITWFFNCVEQGIIMEDDCIPDPTFYTFASAMLEKYKGDERIMHINGTNFLKGKKIVKDSSYYFSNFCHVWGWATWRRAWKYYDVAMKDFPGTGNLQLKNAIAEDPTVSNYWLQCIEAVYNGKIDTWDYQWYYAFWKRNGFAITPSLNMVSNIGFDEEGTRTVSGLNRFSKMKKYPMHNIVHPASIAKNKTADRYAQLQKFKEVYPSLLEKVKFKLNLIRKGLANK